MMNRRKFLKSIGMVTAGLILTRGNGAKDAPLIPCYAEVGCGPPPELPRCPPLPPISTLVGNGLGEYYVTWNLFASDVEWHEIELYGYWTNDDLPCGSHYGMNLDPPRYVSVFEKPSRLVLPWEWAWYLEHKDSEVPWYLVHKFPILDGERIDALGRYLGYL